MKGMNVDKYVQNDGGNGDSYWQTCRNKEAKQQTIYYKFVRFFLTLYIGFLQVES